MPTAHAGLKKGKEKDQKVQVHVLKRNKSAKKDQRNVDLVARINVYMQSFFFS
jgi:hypothetical protein